MEVQWALVLFTVVAGAGAWSFACAVLAALAKRDGLPSVREGIVAIALLVAGGLLSVLHLKHVDRILEALNHPTSGIFIEAALIGVVCAIVALYLILTVRGASERARSAVAVVGLVAGVVFSFECGASYEMQARAAWMTVALPLTYCTTSAALGAGVNLALKAALGREERSISFAGMLAIAAGLVAAACTAAFCLHASAWLGVAVPEVALSFVALAAVVAGGALAMRLPGKALPSAAVVLCAGAAAAILPRVVMWMVGMPTLDFFLMPLG